MTPESVTAEYHRYSVTGKPLPDGWQIREGPVRHSAVNRVGVVAVGRHLQLGDAQARVSEGVGKLADLTQRIGTPA